jgi:hypothetical protein
MAKRKEKQPPRAETRGRKPAYPGDGPAERVSFSLPPSLCRRIETAADQIDVTRSAIVVAAVETILSQSPDRLRDAVAGR